jgi:hypothetical protein
MMTQELDEEEAEEVTSHEEMLEVINGLELNELFVDLYIGHGSEERGDAVVAISLTADLESLDMLIEVLHLLKERKRAKGS